MNSTVGFTNQFITNIDLNSVNNGNGVVTSDRWWKVIFMLKG